MSPIHLCKNQIQTKDIQFTNCSKEEITLSLDLGADENAAAAAVNPSPLQSGVFRFLRGDGTPFLGIGMMNSC